MTKKHWKISFFVVFAMLILSILGSAYTIIDMAVSKAYADATCDKWKSDLDFLIKAVNETDLSKQEIYNMIDTTAFYELKDDSLFIDQLILVFENDKLSQVVR